VRINSASQEIAMAMKRAVMIIVAGCLAALSLVAVVAG
jgi:hypothetical protein